MRFCVRPQGVMKHEHPVTEKNLEVSWEGKTGQLDLD